MSFKAISYENWEYNIALLKEYLQKHNIPIAELSARCNSTTFTMDNVLAGVSYGMISLWECLTKITGIEFRICEVEVVKSKKKNKKEIVFEYVVNHLSSYGNVYVHKNEVKRLGGIDELLHLLEEDGYKATAYLNDDNDYIVNS